MSYSEIFESKEEIVEISRLATSSEQFGVSIMESADPDILFGETQFTWVDVS